MKFRNLNSKGFTLIELLVVIAVIGILAAVILGSLKSARTRAKDAAVLQGMKQFQTLFNLEYNDKGSYSNLFVTGGGYVADSTTCTSNFGSSAYATNAREICKNIVSNLPASPTFRISAGNASNPYSITLLANHTLYMCVGAGGFTYSSGLTSSPGCYGQP